LTKHNATDYSGAAPQGDGDPKTLNGSDDDRDGFSSYETVTRVALPAGLPLEKFNATARLILEWESQNGMEVSDLVLAIWQLLKDSPRGEP